VLINGYLPLIPFAPRMLVYRLDNKNVMSPVDPYAPKGHKFTASTISDWRFRGRNRFAGRRLDRTSSTANSGG